MVTKKTTYSLLVLSLALLTMFSASVFNQHPDAKLQQLNDPQQTPEHQQLSDTHINTSVFGDAKPLSLFQPEDCCGTGVQTQTDAQPNVTAPGVDSLSDLGWQQEDLEWLQTNGYLAVEDFVSAGQLDDPLALIEHENIYAAYDLSTLEMAANNHDPVAQLLYGMNLDSAHKDAASEALQQALVNGGLTAAIHQLHLLYADSRFQEMDAVGLADDYAFRGAEAISDDDQEALVWLIAGNMLNDPMSYLLTEASVLPKLETPLREQLTQRATEKLAKLNREREQISLGSLEPSTPSTAILTHYAQYLHTETDF